MMETIVKLISSKTGLVILLIGAILLGLYIAWQIQVHGFEKKIIDLQKTVDTQDSVIVDLTRDLDNMSFELKTVKKGLLILEEYNKKEREILENGDKTKTDILEAVSSSEENQSWWDSPIPDDLLDALLCN